MKKNFTLFKVLLVAVGLLGGMSAWAGDVTTIYERGTTTAWSDADLTDWPCDYANPSIDGGLAVSSSNGGWACTKSLSVTENSIVTLNATLKTGGASGRSGSYDYLQLGGVKVGFNEQDKVAFVDVDGTTTNLTLTYNRNSAYIVQVVVDQATGTVSYDVAGTKGSASSTTAITSVVYGHSKAGREQYGINPVLQKVDVSEETQDVTSATYAINYKLDGSNIKVTAGTSVVGNTINAETSFWVDSKKYVLDGEQTTSMAITSGTNVLNIKVKEADKYSYTVNAKAGNVVLKQLAAGSQYVGESVSVAYPRYVNMNGTLYEKGATSQQYRHSFEVSENGQIVELSYSSTNINNVLYYSEGEEISGATATSEGSNMWIRSSNSKCGYTENDITLAKFPAGTYNATSVIYSNSSGGTTVKFQFGEEAYDAVVNGSSNWAERGKDFTLAASSDVKWLASGDSKNGLDLIYITGTPTNEVIGTLDYTTTFLGQKKAFSISQGETIKATFQNHGNGEANWFNWLLRFYGTGVDMTLRADNFVIGDDASERSTRNIDLGGADWPVFCEQMKDAEVEMTITYTAEGMFSVNATSKGSSNTFTHTFAYNTALTGDINLELGVEKAWLEVFSVESNLASATIGATGYTTFSSASALNLDDISGATAYYASAVEGTDIILSEATGTVAAGTGLILKGTAGEAVTIPVAATTGTAIEGNLLVGCTSQTPLAANTNYYVLVNNGGTAEFQCLDQNGATIPAGKAYLNATTTGANLRIVFAGETTGIEAIANDKSAKDNGQMFNMAGQRVDGSYKGIVIKNGKKVFVR